MAVNHSSQDTKLIDNIHSAVASYPKPDFTFEFHNFFHPFVGKLIAKLNKESLEGLLDPEFHKKLEDPKFFVRFYKLLPSFVFDIKPHPKEIDVSIGGPYANYNWELFFHVPLIIATH